MLKGTPTPNVPLCVSINNLPYVYIKNLHKVLSS